MLHIDIQEGGIMKCMSIVSRILILPENNVNFGKRDLCAVISYGQLHHNTV